jgi:hypothetical protein
MRFFFWYGVASIAISFVITNIFGFLFSGLLGGLAAIAKPVVFAVTSGAAMKEAGMRGVSSKARGWRRRVAANAAAKE